MRTVTRRKSRAKRDRPTIGSAEEEETQKEAAREWAEMCGVKASSMQPKMR